MRLFVLLVLSRVAQYALKEVENRVGHDGSDGNHDAKLEHRMALQAACSARLVTL